MLYQRFKDVDILKKIHRVLYLFYRGRHKFGYSFGSLVVELAR